MTRLTYDRAELRLGGAPVVGYVEFDLGHFTSEPSPFGAALTPVASGTITAKLTRGQMRRLERVIGVVYGKGWTRTRLPLSGCRWGWRNGR